MQVYMYSKKKIIITSYVNLQDIIYLINLYLRKIKVALYLLVLKKYFNCFDFISLKSIYYAIALNKSKKKKK